MVIAAVLLRIGIRALSITGQTFTGVGFGQPSFSTIITIFDFNVSQSPTLVILIIATVNSPQIVFTLIYLLYNRVYTKMLAMQEWTKFAIRRRGLRVSQPSGIQRSTYWLHLPYRYSIPLIVASSLMHWLISESLSLLRVAFYDKFGMPLEQIYDADDDLPKSNIINFPGYSPEAIVAAMSLGIIMILALCVISFRRFKGDIPLVGNNSRTISAACYRPDGDQKAASKAVKWGAVSHPNGDQPGHCCLTSFEVETPIEGGLYI